MGNKIKFMSGVDVPNVDVSNTTTTKILDVQNATVNDAEIETAEIFDLKVTGEATIDTMRNTQGGVSLGGAVVGSNIAIGNGADGKETGSIAIGNKVIVNDGVVNCAVANAKNAIQIGVGTNNTANSLQIGGNNIYDIENNEIRLYKSKHISDPIDGDIQGTVEEGIKEQYPGSDTDWDWKWDATVYIGKNLEITILSYSLTTQPVWKNTNISKATYDENTGYITFECSVITIDTDQVFDYTIDYTYQQTIPATTARLQPHQLQVPNISLQSQYGSETKTQRDLDTILQNVDLRLNKLERKSFKPSELEAVWNFLANNNEIHGIYIRRSSDNYIYVSGMLFYTSTSTTNTYTLLGTGYSSHGRLQLLSIDIIKNTGNNNYTVQIHPAYSSSAESVTDIQGIEIN